MNMKLSLVAIATLMVVGCGSSSNNDTSPKTEIKTIEDAKSNFKALSALSSLNLSAITPTNGEKINQQKTTTNKCDLGTITVDETTTGSFSLVANGCTLGKIYINGSMTETTLSTGATKMIMSNFTLKDAEANTEIKASSFTVVEKASEYWSTIDGDMSIVTKCFSGSYDFKTIAKIYDAQDGTENAQSGILELNGVRYTFNNPYVTIKTATEEKTILQSELEKQMSNSTTCAI